MKLYLLTYIVRSSMRVFTSRAIALAIVVLALSLTSSPISANTVTTERTEVTLLSDVDGIHPGERFWLALHIKMQPGWHTYWKNPGDSGMAPELQWTLPNGFTAGETNFPAPNRLPISDLMDYGYENDSWLLVSVTPPVALRENAISILMLKARWLVCNDVCIPESGEFSLSLPTVDALQPSSAAPMIDTIAKKLPYVIPSTIYSTSADGTLSFNFPLNDIAPDKLKSVLFFPALEEIITGTAPQKFEAHGDSVTVSLKQDSKQLPHTVQGLISLFAQDGVRKDYEITLNVETAAQPSEDAAPEAPAEITHVVTAPVPTPTAPATGENSQFGILTAILFAFLGGLLLNLMPCVFPVLALKAFAIAKKAEKHKDEVRLHGFAYTAGVMFSFIGLALVLVVIQISGISAGWGYQMQSPIFVSILTVVFFLVGLNLSGFFELPVLFGNVGNEVTAQDNALGSFATGILAVMVATPCTAPFMAPAIGFALTQTIQVIVLVFASIGLGLAMPFLLISIFPTLIRLLPKPGSWMLVFKQFVAFPMFLSALWLLWVLSREAGSNAVFVLLLCLVGLTFALWLAKMRAQFLALLVLVGVIGGIVEMEHMPPQDAKTQPTAEKFSPAGLEALRNQGKAVFVDATADWCITCKVNENVALSSPKVKSLFAEKNITYMVADWTHEDKDITAYLQSFGRAGVPIYVYYPAGGKPPVVLPQILSEAIVTEVINK